MRKTACAALAAAMTLAIMTGGAGAALAEEAVVVASTAPGYALGQVIPDGATVTVPDGANALFLFADGRMVRLHGPFEGRIGGVPQVGTRGGSSALVGGERFFQTDLGASRSINSSGPWGRSLESTLAIDTGVTGTFCVPSGSQPRLLRPRDPDLTAVTLRDTQTGKTARVTWSGKGRGTDDTASWPKALPVRDGAEIIVAGSDRKPRHALRLRVIEEGIKDGAALALRMAEAGCRAQTAALLAPVRDAMVPLNLYLSTDRGLYPTYQPGEPVRMVLQTNRDAHVYCYLRSPHGQLTPIFPPGAAASSLVEGHVPLSFPGDRMPLALRAGQPAGDQEVRCFAAGRNLDSELPGRNEAFRPLSAEAVERLDKALGALRRTDLVMAQVVLRVD